MKIREALEELCELEMSVVVDIEDQPQWRALAAYPFFPPSGNNAAQVPFFFHTFRLVSKRDVLNQQRFLNYEVGMQVLVAPSSVDAQLQSEIAIAVHEALLDVFSANLMLGDGGALVQNIRSENGATLARLEWPPESGVGYVGLDYTLDLSLHTEQLAAPGG